MGKGEKITNRSEPQGRWQCLKKPLDFQNGGMMPIFRVEHLRGPARVNSDKQRGPKSSDIA